MSATASSSSASAANAADLAVNASGIPRAPFVDAVEKFVDASGNIEPVMRKFNETLLTYKRIDLSVQQRKRNLDTKIPELKKALAAVQMLEQHQQQVEEQVEEEADSQGLLVQFEVNDSLYVNAKVAKTDRVCLWLGANVMVEYSLQEAVKLLADKLSQAQRSLEVVDADLAFLREQITTMEVNIARVYNWDVKQRRRAAAVEPSSAQTVKA